MRVARAVSVCVLCSSLSCILLVEEIEGGGRAGGGAGGAGTTTGVTGAAGAGGMPDPTWSCLEDYAAPSGTTIVTHRFRFVRWFDSDTVPTGLTVQLCALLDYACASPLPLDPPSADGRVIFELESSTDAYLQVTADDAIPSYVMLQPSIPPAVEAENLIRLVGSTEWENIVATSGKEYDTQRGTLVVLTKSCHQTPIGGVRLVSETVDADTVEFYARGELPQFGATMTDEQGIAGFVNLPLGFVDVESQRATSGELIGSAIHYSRPGAMTFLPLGPTPRP